MVTGGETGNSCTGTWRRVHYRNSWKVEMVTGGETGIAVQVPGEGLTTGIAGRPRW